MEGRDSFARVAGVECGVVCVSIVQRGKVAHCRPRGRQLTFIIGKAKPTQKLLIQLKNTATDMAAGLVPCVNSSAVIMNGMEPGPMPKKTVKNRMLMTLMYFIHS